MLINDENKASYGVTPTSVSIDTSVYEKGFYKDDNDSVAVMLKWDKHSYNDIWGYVVWVWEAPRDWYIGDILYPAARMSSVNASFTGVMLDTMLKYEFLDGADTTSYTLTGLTPNTQYMVAVSAFTNANNDKYAEDVVYTDVYILSFTAKADPDTPKIISAEPTDDDKIKIDWSHYSGGDGQGYTLYVWTKPHSWFQGEIWYPTSNNSELATIIANSAARTVNTDINTNTVTIDKIGNTVSYWFGVVAKIDGGVSNIFIVHLYVRDTWLWIPRGEYTQSNDWGTNAIDFETGTQQLQQKFTKPTRIFSATFSGMSKTWYEMRSFIDAHKGNLIPFYLWVDEWDRRVRYTVRFAEPKYNPKFQTEVVRGSTESGLARHLHIGFTVDLNFIDTKAPPLIVMKSAEEPEPVAPAPEPVSDKINLYVPTLGARLKDSFVDAGDYRINFVNRTDSGHLAHNSSNFYQQTDSRVHISELKMYSPMDYEVDKDGNKYEICTEGYVSKNGSQIANFKNDMLSHMSGADLTFENGITYHSAFVDHKGNWYVIFSAATGDFYDQGWGYYDAEDDNDYIPNSSNRDMFALYNGNATLLWRRVSDQEETLWSEYADEVSDLVADHSLLLPCKNGFFFSFALQNRSGSNWAITTDNYFSEVRFYDADKNPLFSITHAQLLGAMWWCYTRTLSWAPSYAFYEEMPTTCYNVVPACPMDWQATFSLLKISDTAYLILINQNVNGDRWLLSTFSVYAEEHSGDYNVLLLWDNGNLSCVGLNLQQNNIHFIDDPQTWLNATLQTF